MLIKVKRGWELPDSAATPESVFMNRRTLLKGLATGPLLAAGAAVPFAGGLGSALADENEEDPSAHRYPVEQNPAYTLDRPLTPEDVARSILFACEQPEHVAIPRLMIAPQDQKL